MNNRTKTIYNTSIYSPEWAEIDDYNHRRLYAILGFRTLGDFLGMRVYDFLNMNQNDSGYAVNHSTAIWLPGAKRRRKSSPVAFFISWSAVSGNPHPSISGRA